MIHSFKTDSLKIVIKQNKLLMMSVCVLSIACAVLSVSLFNKQERIILIPATDAEKRMTVYSDSYGQTYLREWAFHVMRSLMNTSHEFIDTQIAEIRTISCTNEDLTEFFKKYTEFIKGSKISSVFFPKTVVFENNKVIVSGTFRYWIGDSMNTISQEKSYALEYKRYTSGLLLLKKLEEVKCAE